MKTLNNSVEISSLIFVNIAEEKALELALSR